MLVLDELNRDDLNALCDKLQTISRVMELLSDAGFAPKVDLTPGRAPVIHLNAIVLPAEVPLPPGHRWPDAGTEGYEDELARLTDWARKLGLCGAVATDQPGQTLSEAGLVDQGDGAEVAAPVPSPVVVEPEPEPVAVAQVAAVAPADQPAPQVPRYTRQQPWTEQEDRLAITECVRLMERGISRNQAAVQVAEIVGRPLDATRFRLSHKLAAAIAAGGAATPDPAPEVAAVVTPPDHQQELAPNAPGKNFTADLDAHLLAIRRNGAPWTAAMDIDLIDLACTGWQFTEISADLGVDVGAVKSRFDLLTGLHRDADDKWARRFTRSAVQEGLARLFPTQAAAE